MPSIELRTSVPVVSGGPVTIAATAHVPVQHTEQPVVVVALPGGGYNRGYFDLRPGLPDYSQAQHHIEHGVTLLAVDPVNVGESTYVADRVWTLEDVAQVTAAAVEDLVQAVTSRSGQPSPVVIGIGHSMGGAIAMVQQASHRSFDAIGLLGWSARHTRRPSSPAGVDETSPAAYRWAYHFETEPPDLVAADIGPTYPQRPDPGPAWGSRTRPLSASLLTRPGVVTAAAAVIDVPVFIGCGERDVVGAPWDEPSAYAMSRDVRVEVFDEMAHLHNFARTRHALWDGLTRWYGDVARDAATRAATTAHIPTSDTPSDPNVQPTEEHTWPPPPGSSTSRGASRS